MSLCKLYTYFYLLYHCSEVWSQLDLIYLFLKEINTFIQFFSFYSSKNPEEVSQFPQNILSIKTRFNINNKKKCVFWAPNYYITFVSKGPCDTEDWSNGCFAIKKNNFWTFLFFFYFFF